MAAAGTYNTQYQPSQRGYRFSPGVVAWGGRWGPELAMVLQRHSAHTGPPHQAPPQRAAVRP